jgi:hypothetical protein
VLYPSVELSLRPEESPDELLLPPPPLLVLGPNVKLLPLLLPLPLPLPNTLSQQSSTSVFERLPDIPVTHLMNLLFEPELVLLSPVEDVSLLVLLESDESEPFFEANAKVTIPLLDAVIKDTAVTITTITSAVIANDVLFICISIL